MTVIQVSNLFNHQSTKVGSDNFDFIQVQKSSNQNTFAPSDSYETQMAQIIAEELQNAGFSNQPSKSPTVGLESQFRNSLNIQYTNI